MPRITKSTRQKKNEPSGEELETQLEEIYQDSDGTIPDMQHIERRGSHAGTMITFLVILFLAGAAGAAWLGFFIFNPSQKFSEDLVTVSISEPDHIVSGIEAGYTIKISNGNKLAFATSDLELKLPENFIITSAEPKASTPKNSSWLIGAIDGGGTKTIQVTGSYAAPKDTHDSLRALLTYRPENFNAEFQKVVNQDVVVFSDSLSLVITRKLVGDKDQFTATYKNLTETAITGARVTLALGPNFKVSKTTPTNPQNSSGALVFSVDIPSSTQGAVVILGSYGDKQETPVSGKIERMIGGIAQLLVQAGTPQEIVSGGSGVAIVEPITFLRTDSGEISIAPGNDVLLKSILTNTTDKPMKLTGLTITGDTPAIKNKGIFDFTNLQTSGNPDVIGKQLPNDRRLATITWNAEQIPGGTELQPGKSIEIAMHITRKTDTPLNLPIKNLVANFVFSATAENGVSLSSEPLVLQLKGQSDEAAVIPTQTASSTSTQH